MQADKTFENQQPEQQSDQQDSAVPFGTPPVLETNLVDQPVSSEPVVTQSPQPQTAKSDSKKRNWIIIGSVFGGIALVLLVVLLAVRFLSPDSSLVVGDWACHKFMYGSSELSGEPTVMLQLKTDGTFVYGQYNDLANNHFAGTYTAAPSNKIRTDLGYEYYNLTFGPTTEYVLDGEKQSTDGRQMSNMEIGIISNGTVKEASLILESSYATYFCETE